MVDRNSPRSPDVAGSTEKRQQSSSASRTVINVVGGKLRQLTTAGGDEGDGPRGGPDWVLVERDPDGDPAAGIDEPPHWELVGKSHWPNTLTWIVVGAFLVTILTAVGVTAFDATARVTVASALIVTVTGALIRLALVWLPPQPRRRSSRKSDRRTGTR